MCFLWILRPTIYIDMHNDAATTQKGERIIEKSLLKEAFEESAAMETLAEMHQEEINILHRRIGDLQAEMAILQNTITSQRIYIDHLEKMAQLREDSCRHHAEQADWWYAKYRKLVGDVDE